MANATLYPGATLTVDLDAVVANWRTLAVRAPTASCGGVVKADGYGLGAGKVASALSGAGCRHFFVATIDEGIALRKSLPDDAVIVVFDGLMAADTATEFDAHSLTPVLNSPGDIKRWSHHATNGGNRSAFLALDTGMNRLGLNPTETEAIAEKPELLDGIEIAYTMSHLACATRRRILRTADSGNCLMPCGPNCLRPRRLLPILRASFSAPNTTTIWPARARLCMAFRGAAARRSPCNKLLV